MTQNYHDTGVSAAIPTLSEWTLLALALTLAAARYISCFMILSSASRGGRVRSIPS
ncbi:MAG: hypothetical protein ACXW29_06690 [Thermoanaerobaculia bacterium]